MYKRCDRSNICVNNSGTMLHRCHQTLLISTRCYQAFSIAPKRTTLGGPNIIDCGGMQVFDRIQSLAVSISSGEGFSFVLRFGT